MPSVPTSYLVVRLLPYLLLLSVVQLVLESSNATDALKAAVDVVGGAGLFVFAGYQNNVLGAHARPGDVERVLDLPHWHPAQRARIAVGIAVRPEPADIGTLDTHQQRSDQRRACRDLDLSRRGRRVDIDHLLVAVGLRLLDCRGSRPGQAAIVQRYRARRV